MAISNHTPIQLPLAIEGATVEIPLTRGFKATVDAIDADLLEFRWFASPLPGYEYARRKTSKTTGVFLHRVILERVVGRPLVKGELTDHINGNPLDNRRLNLRLATHEENMRNRKRASHNHSGYKGVRKTRSGTWRAQISVDGKQIELGRYKTPEAAHQAYVVASQQYHGDFGNSGDE